MGRKVYISSDMSADKALARVAAEDSEAAALWPWILTACDDWGRSEADSLHLKMKVFPAFAHVTEEKITSALALLSGQKLVDLYSVNGTALLSVPPCKWYKYQTHIPTRKILSGGSKLPAPEGWQEAAYDYIRLQTNARGCTRLHTDATPSPSPSPSKKKLSSSSEDATERIQLQPLWNTLIDGLGKWKLATYRAQFKARVNETGPEAVELIAAWLRSPGDPEKHRPAYLREHGHMSPKTWLRKSNWSEYAELARQWDEQPEAAGEPALPKRCPVCRNSGVKGQVRDGDEFKICQACAGTGWERLT